MGDQPDKLELLRAVKRFLDEELLPELEGVHRFHARVASNAIGIVAREIEIGPANLKAQFERLRSLLDDPAPAPADPEELDREVTRMERDLAERIRSGRTDEPGPRSRVLEHLRRTTRERLDVANPTYR